jgi:putative phage-type endonuclease
MTLAEKEKGITDALTGKRHVKVEDEAHWHELRAQNIGGSEVAALFGESPYITRFNLWHQKSGKVARPEFGNERMRWGTLLEPMIAQGIAEEQGWKIQKVRRYLLHPTVKGMGASLDYEILNHPDGPGCLEIKNVDRSVFYSSFQVNEDKSIEAPLHIELQLQHQLAVTGRTWGAIGMLVGGNESHVIIRKRHETTIRMLEEAVAEFWETIQLGQVPEISDSADLATAAKLFEGINKVAVIDDGSLLELCELWERAKQNTKEAKDNEDLIKAKFIEVLSKAEADVAVGDGYKVTYKEMTRAEHMVKASTYRVLRVTKMKLKEANDNG